MMPRTLRSLRRYQPRRSRGWQPSLIEALEGRALMATNALDPGFGTNGAVLSTVNSDDGYKHSTVAAVAVMSSGKIVTAETHVASGDSAGTFIPLAVRRYNANGTLDTTFGTNGTTAIPFSTNAATSADLPRNIAIQPDGKIVLADGGADASYTHQSVVARLTSTGQLDPTFGTGGVYALPSSLTALDGSLSVLVETSNGVTSRIVVGGVFDFINPSDRTLSERTAGLIGLTPSGGIDSSFGTNGLVTVPLAQSAEGTSGATLTVSGLQQTPTGQILLGVTASVGGYLFSTNPDSFSFTLSRLSSAGAIDPTFGSGGTLALTATILANDFVVLPTGQIVLAGSVRQANPTTNKNEYHGAVVQLLPDGTVDPTFTTVPTPDSITTFERMVVGTGGAITAVEDDAGQAYRYLRTGLPDTSVGVAGRIAFHLPSFSQTNSYPHVVLENTALGITADGSLVVGGTRSGNFLNYNSPIPVTYSSQSDLVQLRAIPLRSVTNDYDGDGKSDLAAILPSYTRYVYRGSSTSQAVARPIGMDDPQAIAAPGDYDGDGQTDQVTYDQTAGYFSLTLSASNGGYKLVDFGAAGAGNSLPAPGDYDGDGRTDLAVYLTQVGVLAYRPSSGGPDVYINFGLAGEGNAIPVPGDYDGDGKTDPAVYLPQIGVLAYRPSTGGDDVYESFGAVGAGNSLPAPGDYDGDGRTDVAVYLPEAGVFAYRPSSGEADVLTSFGPAGTGGAIPIPGDYDGDGKDDIALYLPAINDWVYRPSSGGSDVNQGFGIVGAGNTIPATVVSLPQSSTVAAMSLRSVAPAESDAGVVVFLDDTTPRKRPNA